jgi:hypothetical protein
MYAIWNFFEVLFRFSFITICFFAAITKNTCIASTKKLVVLSFLLWINIWCV